MLKIGGCPKSLEPLKFYEIGPLTRSNISKGFVWFPAALTSEVTSKINEATFLTSFFGLNEFYWYYIDFNQ